MEGKLLKKLKISREYNVPIGEKPIVGGKNSQHAPLLFHPRWERILYAFENVEKNHYQWLKLHEKWWCQILVLNKTTSLANHDVRKREISLLSATLVNRPFISNVSCNLIHYTWQQLPTKISLLDWDKRNNVRMLILIDAANIRRTKAMSDITTYLLACSLDKLFSNLSDYKCFHRNPVEISSTQHNFEWKAYL